MTRLLLTAVPRKISLSSGSIPRCLLDVYFMIGRMGAGGTTSSHGLLIGTELFSRAPNSPDSELTDWHKQVTRSIDYLPNFVAHELIHYQQKYYKAANDKRQAIKSILEIQDFQAFLKESGY